MEIDNSSKPNVCIVFKTNLYLICYKFLCIWHYYLLFIPGKLIHFYYISPLKMKYKQTHIFIKQIMSNLRKIIRRIDVYRRLHTILRTLNVAFKNRTLVVFNGSTMADWQKLHTLSGYWTKSTTCKHRTPFFYSGFTSFHRSSCWPVFEFRDQ